MKRVLRILVVDADAALHGDGNGHRLRQRRHACRHQSGLAHKAGAEAARLHPVGRAAHIEIDLVIAEVFGDFRRFRQPDRIAAAQLQPQRMLGGVEAQQAATVAVQHRLSRHHLGIEQRVRRQCAVQHAAGTVRPVHHRRDAEAVCAHG